MDGVRRAFAGFIYIHIHTYTYTNTKNINMYMLTHTHIYIYTYIHIHTCFHTYQVAAVCMYTHALWNCAQTPQFVFRAIPQASFLAVYYSTTISTWPRMILRTCMRG